MCLNRLLHRLQIRRGRIRNDNLAKQVVDNSELFRQGNERMEPRGHLRGVKDDGRTMFRDRGAVLAVVNCVHVDGRRVWKRICVSCKRLFELGSPFVLEPSRLIADRLVDFNDLLLAQDTRQKCNEIRCDEEIAVLRRAA